MALQTIIYIIIAIIIAALFLKVTRKIMHLAAFTVVAVVVYFALKALIGW
ncbi:hypothetical protein GOV06_03960 [Candidatus Woesearchaeota archaeon]|nr:hypothetical protein [Candidatus Woesearchaeota archaeon]